jgi:glycine/D-amino acid oxidase-like deaminating enzyme
MQKYEVIIIGGGFLGVSTAYQLANAGIKTLLLEAGDIGSGTSGSCSGRAQVCEGHLDPLNITLIRDGLKRLETLEKDLEFDFEWRRTGLFLLLRDEKLWQHWIERSKKLTEWGIPTEVVDRASLQKAEPNINTNGLLGAAYSVEGMLDPLRFIHAYARAAIQQGATLRRNSPVISMEVHDHKVTCVKTATETFFTEKIAVMAGAWESEVTRLAGVEIPLQNTHAESLITEPIPRMIFNNVGLSDSYEIINGKDRAVAIGIIPEPNGTVEIAEAVFRTDEKHHRVSAWGISAMAIEMAKIFPFLSNVSVIRSWGRPTSFAPDEEPIIGWVPQLDNMYVATSLVETITTVPLLSEWMSMMIQGQSPPLSLDLYSPARFSKT